MYKMIAFLVVIFTPSMLSGQDTLNYFTPPEMNYNIVLLPKIKEEKEKKQTLEPTKQSKPKVETKSSTTKTKSGSVRCYNGRCYIVKRPIRLFRRR